MPSLVSKTVTCYLSHSGTPIKSLRGHWVVVPVEVEVAVDAIVEVAVEFVLE
jgi:hypothetical protein